MRYDWKSYPSRLVPFSAGYPGREIRAIAARLEEAAVLRATATTGAEAHGDSIFFTRPWKGRSSTVMHTLLVFPQPLEGVPFPVGIGTVARPFHCYCGLCQARARGHQRFTFRQ